MQRLVVCVGTLVLNVMLDDIFIPVLSDRADVVAVRPELAAPQLFLHFRAGLENFSCRDALDCLHDPFRTVHWHTLHQEVDVILIRPNFEKRDFVAAADLLTCLFQLVVYGFAENHSPIFRGANKVVHQH